MSERAPSQDPVALKGEPKTLRRALLSLSRLGRAIVELAALSWDEVTAPPLQRAARELNITPRLAQEYQLGDIQAELEELTEAGWLLDMGGAYRCHPELTMIIVSLLSAQSVQSYKRQVMKLFPSALQQAARAAVADGPEALSLYTVKVSRQLQRDLMIADRLGDLPAFYPIIWSIFELEALPRLWVAQCLKGLEPALLERLPLPLSLWVSAELALVELYQAPALAHGEQTSLARLKGRLDLVERELSSRGESLEEQLAWLSGALLELMSKERGVGRYRHQTRSFIQTCLESCCEALMIGAILEGSARRAPLIFEALSARFEQLRATRALRSELGRRQLDPTGRLRLWLCFSLLTRGDEVGAQSVWSEGVRAFNRQSVGRLLGADALLTQRVSALCLYALKSPPTFEPLRLPSTSHLRIDVIPSEGSYLDELLTTLSQPEQGLSPVRQRALRSLCSAPLSPLWELLALTSLAWAGVVDDELDEQQSALKDRADRWLEVGWGLLAESVNCLRSSVAPTHLSGLKEPSPEWLMRLEQLEELVTLLVEHSEGYAEDT